MSGLNTFFVCLTGYHILPLVHRYLRDNPAAPVANLSDTKSGAYKSLRENLFFGVSTTRTREENRFDLVCAANAETHYKNCYKDRAIEIERLQNREKRLAKHLSWFRHWYPRLSKEYDKQVFSAASLEQDLGRMTDYSQAAYEKISSLTEMNRSLAMQKVMWEEEVRSHQKEARDAQKRVKSVEEKLAETEAEVRELRRETEELQRQIDGYKDVVAKIWEEKEAMKGLRVEELAAKLLPELPPSSPKEDKRYLSWS